MASYKKYAENLIGDWEKDIYEPQKEVSKSIYQTNWNKITNDYNTVKDKLARNFNLAQMDYSNTLNDIQNESFNRMQNANIDLANRGLSSSGILDLVSQGDTQVKGEASDKALANLLAANNASLEGLSDSVMGLGEGQTKLAGDLAGDIGKLTDADAANNQQYAGLLANIAEGAANRAASRARSGGGSSKSKEEKEYDEIKRKILIADTLASPELSDQQKKEYLNTYLDVPGDAAIAAVDGYNNNVKRAELTMQLGTLQNKLADIQASRQKRRENSPDTLLNKIVHDYNILSIPRAREYRTQNKINDLNKKRNELTYTDLAEILYGNK